MGTPRFGEHRTRDRHRRRGLHADEEDRLQRNSCLQPERRHGSNWTTRAMLGKRRQPDTGSARCLVAFMHDRMALVARWSVSAGLRYEDIEQKRTRFETRSGRTAEPAAAFGIRKMCAIAARTSTRACLLPGIGLEPGCHRERTVCSFGAHKGFTAPSNAPGVKEETAFNYETGARVYGRRWNGEVTAFLSDYDNLLGANARLLPAPTARSAMHSTAMRRPYAASKHRSSADLSTDARACSCRSRLTFTRMDATFDSDVADTDFFGDVRRKAIHCRTSRSTRFTSTIGWMRWTRPGEPVPALC